eukprot:tig00000880_g5213.t1
MQQAPVIVPGERPVFFLVGPGRVGKSTCTRMLQMLYSNFHARDVEYASYREPLRENLEDALRVVLEHVGFAEDVRFAADKLDELRALLKRWSDAQGEAGASGEKALVMAHFKELAQDPGFRASMLRVLHDPKNPLWPGILAVPSAEYLIDHHARILSADYRPTQEDMLHIRVRSTGISSTEYKGTKFGDFTVYDTGGERSERKKWPDWWARDGKQMASRVFPVFVARLDSFGEQLFEAEGDMMRDMVDCWRGTLAAPFVKEAATPYFLLLSKVDGLRKTLGDGSRLKQVFPGYSGGSSVDAAVDFVRSLFEGVAAEVAPNLSISVHVVNNIDPASSGPAWDEILTTALRTLGRIGGGGGGGGGPGGPRGPSLAAAKAEMRARLRIDRAPSESMKREWRVARIFLSSTFQDMHGERDQITRIVFPGLQDRCNSIRVTVVEVDLRWGVTAHEADNNEVVEICLREIDRARPFFVGLIGDRYGWIPDSFSDDPFLEWIRKYPARRSVTELEMHYGAMRDPTACLARFYIRDGSFLRTAPPELVERFVETSEHSKGALAELKQRVRATFPDRTFDYPCTWAGLREEKAMVGSLEAFSARMLEDLWTDVQSHFATGGEDDMSELGLHRRFMELRSAKFIGRERLLSDLEGMVEGAKGTRQPCVVVGLPGSGKSSLLAAFCTRHADKHRDTHVIPFFVGTTPTSTSLATLLRSVNGALEAIAGLSMSEEERADTVDGLREEFAELLTKAAKKKAVLIVIDALNQLDTGSGAKWIPASLPEGARLLVSSLEGPVLEAMRARAARPRELPVGPLDAEERRELVRRTLAPFRKKLSEARDNDQLGMLVAKPESASPLYLAVACEELRLFGVYEKLTAKIASLPEDMPGLIDAVLERLEGFLGPDMVRDSLCAVQCSRGGFPEPDLVAFIGELKVQREGGAGGESTIVANAWARIYLSLQVLLRPVDHSRHNNGVIDFFHRQIAKAVIRRYFDGDFLTSQAYQSFHWLMANFLYVRWQADPNHAKALRDVVYHATASGHAELLQKTLLNLSFIECRARAGLVWEMVAEYVTVPETLRPSLPHFADYQAFVSANAALLTASPELTLPLAVNALGSAGSAESPVAYAAQYICANYARTASAVWASPRSPSEPRVMTYNMRPYKDEPLAQIAVTGQGVIVGLGESVRVWWDERTGSVRKYMPGLEKQQLGYGAHPAGRHIAVAVADGVLV